jgi:hypothetical protein
MIAIGTRVRMWGLGAGRVEGGAHQGHEAGSQLWAAPSPPSHASRGSLGFLSGAS